MKEIIFASANKGKISEVKEIFKDTAFSIVSLYELGNVPEIIENGETFEDNARIKAKAIHDIYKTPVIADDSGLAVEQLGGQPGIHSARYAGADSTNLDNNLKLLGALSEFEMPHRAKFVCCAVYLDDNCFLYETGELPGVIIPGMKGEKGFGYDPLFIPDGFDKTLAEIDLKEKNKISHRAKAFNKLKIRIIKEKQNEV